LAGFYNINSETSLVKGNPMKKAMILTVLFVLTATAVFGQIPKFKISVGAGGYFSAGFGGEVGEGMASGTARTIGAGSFAFLDATFVELAVGFSLGSVKFKEQLYGSVEETKLFTALDFNILAKWPFAVGKFSIFPLLGVGTQVFLMKGDYFGRGWLWFHLGAGMDFSFTDTLFLRGEFLYGMRLNERGRQIELGHGPTVKIAVGVFLSGRSKKKQEAAAAERQRVAEDINTQLTARQVRDTRASASDEGITIRLSNIAFQPNSAVLEESELQKIREIAEILKTVPGRRIQVTGHTALAGTEAAQLATSQERAQAVADALIALGARRRSDISVRGYGAERPLANNNTAAGQAQNRRVEIMILE
jgi:outer membrane protein OmpA-like peptidoglycan-associated protein